MAIDSAIAGALHRIVGHFPLADAFVAICAGWLLYIAIAAFIAVFFIYRGTGKAAFLRRTERMRHGLVVVMGASAIFGVVIPFIRLFYHPARPFVEFGWKPLIAMSADAPSFPSGHMAGMFFLAAYTWQHNRRTGAWLYALALITGVARAYVGVHWASDLIAGAFIGVFTGYFADRLAPRLSATEATDVY